MFVLGSNKMYRWRATMCLLIRCVPLRCVTKILYFYIQTKLYVYAGSAVFSSKMKEYRVYNVQYTCSSSGPFRWIHPLIPTVLSRACTAANTWNPTNFPNALKGLLVVRMKIRPWSFHYPLRFFLPLTDRLEKKRREEIPVRSVATSLRLELRERHLHVSPQQYS